MKAFETKQEKCLEKTYGKGVIQQMSEDFQQRVAGFAEAEAEMESAKSALANISWNHVKCPEAMTALDKPAEGTPAAAAYANLKGTETGARLTRTYERDLAIKKLEREEWDYCVAKHKVEEVKYPESACAPLYREFHAANLGIEFHKFAGFFVKPLRIEYYNKHVYTRNPVRWTGKDHVSFQAQVEAGMKKFKADYLKALASYENSLDANDRAALKAKFDDIKSCFADRATTNMGDLDATPSFSELDWYKERKSGGSSTERRVASREAADRDTNTPVAIGPCGTGSADSALQALDDARTNREIKRGNMERAKSAYEKNTNDAALKAQYEQAKQAFQSAREQAFAAYNRARASHPRAPELNFNTWKEKNHWQSACWKEKRANFLRGSSGSE